MSVFALIERAESLNVGATAGPHLIGYFLNWGLFGVLSVQVFLYYLAFPKDRTTIKALVYGLYILDTVQTIIITNDAFVKYGLEFANVQQLSAMRNAWLSIPLISAFNGTIVQLFFAYRIMNLAESKAAGIVIAVLALASGGAGIAEAAQSKIINNLAVIAVKTRTTLTIWLSVSAACDVIIAIAMTFFLSQKKSGFNSSTDDAITRIIRLTVETGTITAVLAVLTVIMFFVFPTRSYWNVPIDVLGKFYSNNLLVIFNRRIHISGGRNAPYNSGDGSTSRHGHTQNITMESMPPIRIQREVWTDAYKLGPATDSHSARFDPERSYRQEETAV